jgi:phosphoenolpyruvate carboxykinase (diphosphate)
MYLHERRPDYLIEHGHLEKLADFEHEGRLIEASRLGYRITANFVATFFGRVFSAPDTVFTDEMLKPELQSMEDFIDGLDNIIETQRRVALLYFEDGGVDAACPPLQALLHIMAHGHFDGKTLQDPALRALFTREALLASDWYKARLDAKARGDLALWDRHIASLEKFIANPNYQSELRRLGIHDRLAEARQQRSRVCSPEYRASLVGMIGTDPLLARD